jgi:hypothetical protein
MVERHEGDFVEIRRVSTPFEAQLLIGRLLAEGIDARPDSLDVLQDEWAAVQRVMGNGLIRIFVREATRAEAERILATPVPDLEEQAEEPDPPAS